MDRFDLRHRVPAFDERAGSYRHPKSRLDERDWLKVMALRAGGVRGALLAEVFGVERSTICTQAARRGLPPPHLAQAAARDAPRPEMAFAADLNDPVGTFLSLAATIGKALDEGRHADAAALNRREDGGGYVRRGATAGRRARALAGRPLAVRAGGVVEAGDEAPDP